MTEEMKTQLTKALEEEKADYEKYKKMSSELWSEDMKTCAGIINDIASDEETHICLIQHILDKEE